MFKKSHSLVISSVIVVSLFVLSLAIFTLNAEAKTTIKFFHYIRGRERNVMLEMIEKFEEKYPDIEVKFEFVPETDHMVKMQTMIAAGNSPDLIGLKDVMVPDMVRLGVLKPLDELLSAEDSMVDMNDWVSGIRETLTINGSLWAVPEQWSPNVLYVNQKLFNEAGVAIPDVGNRWEDILDYGKKLTRDTNGDGKTDIFGFGGISGRIDNLAGPIWNYGGKVFDSEKSEYLLNTEPVKKVYQFIVDLDKAGIVPRPDQSEGVAHWEIERMAMVWNNRYIMPRYQSFDWAESDMRVVPHPVGPESDRNRASMRVLTIPKTSPHPEEAAKLLQFLTSKEGFRGYTKLGRVTPIYKSILFSTEHQNLINSFENAEPYIYAAVTWKQGFLPVQWEKVRRLTEDAVEAIRREMGTIDEVLEKLNKQMTELYQELPPEERIFGGRP